MPAFNGNYMPCNLHANPCTLCMHGSLQSGLARKRAFEGRTAGKKKPLGVAAASGINVTGMMNHSARLFAPYSAALEPPAVVPAEAGR
ncbi:hypothetical protein ERHA54_06100 [Erwinia rhapontici]|nr:hypothetical protein ERHA54_06100 [Erwinia rhapontici]